MKTLFTCFFTVAIAMTATGNAAERKPAVPARDSSSEAKAKPTSDVSELLLTDPRDELRHLAKNLRLGKTQRQGISAILEERNRQIHLLFDIDLLSQEHRDHLAAKVMEDSDIQIENLLKDRQKRKFDKQRARQPEKFLNGE